AHGVASAGRPLAVPRPRGTAQEHADPAPAGLSGVRILVAGLGAIGQRHARNLRTLLGDRLELLALRSRRLRHVVTESLTADAGHDVAAVLGARVFTDTESALAAAPDAVFICTPSSLHL